MNSGEDNGLGRFVSSSAVSCLDGIMHAFHFELREFLPTDRKITDSEARMNGTVGVSFDSEEGIEMRSRNFLETSRISALVRCFE